MEAPFGTNPVSEQLELSLVARDLISSTPEGYSNTVELFDLALTYSSVRIRENAAREERFKKIRGRNYRIGMSTAIIKGANGKTCFVMPGQREDLVEKALRKIACEREEHWKITEDAGLVEIQIGFTIYQIRKILADTGHHYKAREIEEALQVLQGARIDIETEDGELVGGVRSGIFQTYAYRKTKKTNSDGSDSYGWVKFHPLVTASILQKTFRRIDFKKLMTLRYDLARWLYQRMSHYYSQASIQDQWMKTSGYGIGLDTIIRESGLTKCERMRDNARSVRLALQELVDQDILHSFLEEIQYSPTQKRGTKQIGNIVWLLKPSAKFVDDIVSENSAKKREREGKRVLKPSLT